MSFLLKISMIAILPIGKEYVQKIFCLVGDRPAIVGE